MVAINTKEKMVPQHMQNTSIDVPAFILILRKLFRIYSAWSIKIYLDNLRVHLNKLVKEL